MKDVATFTNTSTSTGLTTAWDFTGNPNNDSANNNYWNIDTNGIINDGYPYLNGYVSNALPVVSSLGSASYINGNWGTDTTPTLEFSINDADVADQASYRIQIDDTASFASPVVDYTSGPKSQGSYNFFVGQTAGEGTSGVGAYTVGAAGQTLSDGQYYWRVMGIDSNDASGSYTTANSGAIAFGVDTTAPTVPGTPAFTTPTNDTTPALTWTASTDAGAGMHSSIPYDVQWSPSSDFTGLGTSITSVPSNSYTFSSALTEGTWYIRLRAWDNLDNGPTYSATTSIVIDTTAPEIESVTPLDNVSSVGLADNLVLNFSEAVDVASGNIVIKRTADDSTFATIDVTSGLVTGTGTDTITVNPSSAFAEATGYYVQIDATAFDDPAGNSYAGINSASTWNFTSDDLTDPILVSPESSSAQNSLPISFVLGETPASGSLQLVFSGSASRTVTLTNLSAGSHSFTLNLSNPLSTAQVASISGGSSIPDGTYTVTLQHQDQSATVTLSDASSDVIIDTAAPTVSSKTPALSATGVALDANLVVEFDEPVELASGLVRIRRWHDAAVVENIDVSGAQISGSGTDTLTINPSSNFDNAALYYIEITDTAIRDPAGNNFAGITNSATWKFTTLGVTNNGRISASPLSASITEGDSQLFGLLLDEPIIGGPTVTVSISSSDTSLTSDAGAVSFVASDWTEARNFVLSATDDSLDNGDRTATITLVAASGSEYYNNYTKQLTITILDNDSTVATDTPSGGGASQQANNSERGGTGQQANADDTAAQLDETRIVLNDLDGFSNGAGVKVSVVKGQILYFTVDGEEHTATVTEITDQYVVITLASTPQTVKLLIGQTGQYDVNQDGKKDIDINVVSVANGLANISFKSLAERIKQPVSTNETAIGRASNNLFWVLTAVFAGVIIMLLVIGKFWSNKKSQTPVV